MGLSKLFLGRRDRQHALPMPHVDSRRHHTIISGTGRAGTTFLMKLLTNLGLETGYDPSSTEEFVNCKAGLEKDIRDPDAPYLVKSPWICDYIEEIVANPEIAIDYAIIPMRTLEAAAESRRNLQDKPGGLWHTDDPGQQEAVLARQLHKLLVGLAKSDAKVILLHYPRLTQDPQYLLEKLRPLVGDRPFLEVFEKTVDRSLVHQYTTTDRA